jgi:NTP pyrophosphatase (non-canonical NTP hydrolase)
MTFDDFQTAALRTSAAPYPERERPMVQTLGLCGEAGEVAELVKKASWHGKPVDLEKLANELGDVLWYVADLASHYGLSLHQIAAGNVEKLRQRYPDGFVTGGGVR